MRRQLVLQLRALHSGNRCVCLDKLSFWTCNYVNSASPPGTLKCSCIFTKVLVTKSVEERSWVMQLVRNTPHPPPQAFYGTRTFITVFTRTRYWSVSWSIWIQSIPSYPTFSRSILILSSNLRLRFPSDLFYNVTCISHLSHAPTRPSFERLNYTGCGTETGDC
jgi:hypothetical protein